MMQSQTTKPTRRRRRQSSSSSSLLPVVVTLSLLLVAIVVGNSENFFMMTAVVVVEASPPASLHKTTRRLGSSSSSTLNNNGGGGGSGLERVVIVQPSNLQSSKTQTTSNNNGGGGDDNTNYVILHQWPHPNDAPKMGEAMSDEEKAKFLYEVAKFSLTQQQGGGVAASASAGGEQKKEVASSEAMMKASYSDMSASGEDSSIASYEEWVAMQKSLKMGSTSGGASSSSSSTGGRGAHVRSSSSRINMDAHGYYLPQQHFTSTEGGVDSSSSSLTGGREAPTVEDWMAMQQAIPEKQVILRPMSQLDDPSSSTSSSKKKTLSVPALLGSTQKNGGLQEPQVYYYDTQGLVSYSSPSQSTPELTLPDEVYTASGQKLKLSDVHDGGRAEVYLEMNPKTVLGKSLNELNSIPKTMSSGSVSSSFFSSSTTAGNAAQQSQDQMIVFLTVATMAIMVGMLSARRLRSRKFLEQCMTPDLEDDLDDVRYDKKFDGNGRSSGGNGFENNRYTAAAGAASYAYTTSGGSRSSSPGRYSEYEGSETSLPHFSDLYPTQSSSIMGSLSRRSGYGTNDGGVHWRGDMEKFDV